MKKKKFFFFFFVNNNFSTTCLWCECVFINIVKCSNNLKNWKMKWLYYDFLAGCFGGACGVIIGHPLDTIKTWQQASNSKVNDAIYQIIQRNNGLNGFYRGMLFPLVTTGAINSILFGIYGNHFRQLQRLCHSDLQREQYEYRHVFAAGSIAGFIQSFIACPIELIKVRLQTHNYYYEYIRGEKRTPLNCMKQILRNQGISGLYRGLLPMMCRDVFPYGIYMLTYQKTVKFFETLEFVKRKRKDHKENIELDTFITTASGAFAGILSWVVVIPFDVIKTIMQAETDSNYKNMKHCIQTNIQKYGWKILFRGSWILLFRAIPVNAATFLGYEYFLEFCRKNRDYEFKVNRF